MFNNNLYKQVGGVAIGNPLSPSIANYYMEFFEEKALESSSMKPSIWLRYVDDVFAIWPHGHLNSIHKNIKLVQKLKLKRIVEFLS